MTAVSLPNVTLKAGYVDHEASWGADLNRNLRILDAIIQLRVADKDLTSPPGSPAGGDAYIVGASPSGAWTSHAQDIAVYQVGDDLTSAWVFVTPKSGWRAYVVDETTVYEYSGSAWVAAGGGGGLTNFTESNDATGPNTSVTVSKFQATNAASHVDVVLAPKGGGAIIAATPDSSTTGGNKRGPSAVDWQTQRGGATEVASGSQSVIGGGIYNKASGAYSCVPGGYNNTASGSGAFCTGFGSSVAGFAAGAIGSSCVVNGSSSFASGSTVTVSGAESFGWGNTNTADAPNSSAGGLQAHTRGISCIAESSGGLAGSGSSQHRRFVLKRDTSNNTPAQLITGSAGSPSATNQVNLQNGSATIVTGSLVARDLTSGDTSTWTFSAALKRYAAVTSLVGSATVTLVAADSGASTWAFAITADVTNDCVAFTVTGETGKAIRWVATILSSEAV